MGESLKGRRVALLVTDGFEQSELEEPCRALREAGAAVAIVAPKQAKEHVRAWDKTDWGDTFTVDVPLDSARVEDYDSLVLPGGVLNPDQLRTNTDAVALVKAFASAGKPVAAICHGPWLLVESGLAREHRVTSYPSVKTDLVNAGGDWVDQEVVVDGGLITSRSPDDLPAFNREVIAALANASASRGGASHATR